MKGSPVQVRASALCGGPFASARTRYAPRFRLSGRSPCEPRNAPGGRGKPAQPLLQIEDPTRHAESIDESSDSRRCHPQGWVSRLAEWHPSIDQRSDAVDIFRAGIEYGVNVPRRSYDSVPDKRDPPDEHIANVCAIEIRENAAKIGQRAGASSSAWRLSAIPSARSSSGSRDASLMRR